MITETQVRKSTRIDISPLKKAGIKGIVGDLISAQRKEMDIEDFLVNVKAWENLLKKEAQK